MPKWVVGTFLSFSLLLFLFGTILKLNLNNGTEVFILAFALFLPCYIALFKDIADRELPHYWSYLMIVMPFLGPYAYFLVRERLYTGK